MDQKVSAFLAFTFLLSSVTSHAQENRSFDFKSSYGATVTYSPNSSHILIGQAEGREITTAGFEYTHRLFERNWFKLDYAGEISPLYRESDPTISGIQETYNGVTTTRPLADPSRIVLSHSDYLGQDCATYYPACVPMYGVSGPNESTYGFATAPFGLRAVLRPERRIQPTFTVNTGFVITQRAIPVDGAAILNYQFSLGPGLRIFTSRQSSFGVEYLYRHISNGNADVNPGIDQGVFRFTFSHHR